MKKCFIIKMLTCLLHQAWKLDVRILNDLVPIYSARLLSISASRVFECPRPEAVFPTQLWCPLIMHKVFFFFFFSIAKHCLIVSIRKPSQDCPSSSTQACFGWCPLWYIHGLFLVSQIERPTACSNLVFSFHFIKDWKIWEQETWHKQKMSNKNGWNKWTDEWNF